MSYDRHEILTRVDLGALCDEVLGPRRGRGTSASWSCPDPGHGPQTGRTPPVSLYMGRSGLARWHCHACGADGTAIDLVMTTHGCTVKDAMGTLAARTGVTAIPPGTPPRLRPRPSLVAPRPEPTSPPDGCVDEYVQACARALWLPAGRPVLEYLHARGFADPILARNRVGADPGPRQLGRSAGLPSRGPGAVFPLLERKGQTLYCQTRYLDPARAGRRYDNPAAALAPNPRLGLILPPGDVHHPRLVVVCEGAPDALSAAQAGYRAAAIIGAALPDPTLAQRLVEQSGPATFLVTFDADHHGQRGATRLRDLLARTPGAGPVRVFSPPHGDLNAWAMATGSRFGAEFTRAAVIGPPTRSPRPTRVAEALPLAVGLAP
jgi:hypothetical protein